MAWTWSEVLKRAAWQLTGEREFEDGVTVEFRCKSCGEKFKIRLHPKWKSDDDTEEKQELELNVQCPKCKSYEVDIPDHPSKF